MKQVRRAGWSVALIAAFAVCGAYGDDVTITSTYDAETDTWIGDVVALTNALKNAVANQTIYLEKGVYDLSALSDDRAPSSNGMGYGDALIGLHKDNLRLAGATGKPEDVVLMATNADYRIINLYNTGTQLHGVTVKGGYADTNNVSKSGGSFINGYQAGGGAMFIGNGTVISNCHFTANRGRGAGGAVSGNNAYRGTVYDSVFYGNNDDAAHEAAAVAKYTTLYRCTVTNNVYGSTESAYGCVLNVCKVYDSLIAHNTASQCAGLRSGLAVNCRFLCNYQTSASGGWNNAGGAGARDSVLTNCYFYGNSAYRLGGAIRGGTVVNCTVVSNATRHATDAYGGGIHAASLVEGCTVMSNITTKGGGGLNACTFVTNTVIAYNMAKLGGGARSSALTGCTIEHNVAQDYASSNYGGAGGGIAYGAATNCVFRDNSCSATYQTDVVKGCDIADTSVNAKEIDSCVIHEVQNDEMARAVGNVAYPSGHVASNIFLFGTVQEMRNCLVTNCTWKSLPGSFVNSAMFDAGGGVTSCVDNCTFIDNHYYLLTRHFSAASKSVAFSNCIFLGNRLTSREDVTTMESAYLVLSNCVYGTLGGCTTKAEGFENFGCTSITERAAYKFTGKEPDPYSLKRSSPLRGWGLLLDWMEDGTDLAGNPRLRDGKADIGCYQRWLDPVGSVFSIR